MDQRELGCVTLGRKLPELHEVLWKVLSPDCSLLFYKGDVESEVRVVIDTKTHRIDSNLLDARDNYYNYTYPPNPVHLEPEIAEWISEQVQKFNMMFNPTGRYARYEFYERPIHLGRKELKWRRR